VAMILCSHSRCQHISPSSVTSPRRDERKHDLAVLVYNAGPTCKGRRKAAASQIKMTFGAITTDASAQSAQLRLSLARALLYPQHNPHTACIYWKAPACQHLRSGRSLPRCPDHPYILSTRIAVHPCIRLPVYPFCSHSSISTSQSTCLEEPFDRFFPG
jgi:hypothetical protein